MILNLIDGGIEKITTDVDYKKYNETLHMLTFHLTQYQVSLECFTGGENPFQIDSILEFFLQNFTIITVMTEMEFVRFLNNHCGELGAMYTITNSKKPFDYERCGF